MLPHTLLSAFLTDRAAFREWDVSSMLHTLSFNWAHGESFMLADSIWEMVFDMPQIAVIMGCLVPIVGIIASCWYKAQRARSENELKRSMVERGMSADEIERVMAAHATGHHA